MIKMKVGIALQTGKSLEWETCRIENDRQHIDCRDLIAQQNGPWLIIKKHIYLQTQFILTTVSPYLLLAFDAAGNFKEKTLHNNEHPAPYIVLVSHPQVLLVDFRDIPKDAEFETLFYQKNQIDEKRN
jgi:hypothetical protein